MRVGNVSRLAFDLSVFSTIQGKMVAKPFKAECSDAILGDDTIATITAGPLPNVPFLQASTSGRVLVLAPFQVPVLQNN